MVGSVSPITVVLLSRSLNRGNVRVGSVVGVNERNSGLLPLSPPFTSCCEPRSLCSHAYVNVSPESSSDAEADSTNGV